MPESRRGNAGLSLAANHSLTKGEVVGCYFDGFEEPEMVKDRPVMILSVSPARPGLEIVVPLSTTPPSRIELWHHKLSTASQWDIKNALGEVRHGLLVVSDEILFVAHGT